MIHGLDTGFLVAAKVREHAEHAGARYADAGALGGRRPRYRPAGIGGVHPRRHRPPSFHAAARHERGTSCCRAVVDGERRRASVPRRWCRAAVSHMAAAVRVGPQATAGYPPCRNLPAGRHPIAPHHQPVGEPAAPPAGWLGRLGDAHPRLELCHVGQGSMPLAVQGRKVAAHFRDVYASLIRRWLDVDPTPILGERKIALPLV